MTPELQAIINRVDKIERQIAELYADPDETRPGRTIVAQNFLVTDDEGVRRAELGMSIPDGQPENVAWPWLALFDSDENVRACVGVGGKGASGPIEGPWIELYSANKQPIVEVRAEGTRTAILLRSAVGEACVALSVDALGQPSVQLTSGDAREAIAEISINETGPVVDFFVGGKKRTRLVAHEDGAALFLRSPRDDTPNLNLEATSDAASIAVEKNSGLEGPKAKLAIDGDGPRLAMTDANGRNQSPATAHLAVHNHEPYIVLGKEGKVVWSAHRTSKNQRATDAV